MGKIGRTDLTSAAVQGANLHSYPKHYETARRVWEREKGYADVNLDRVTVVYTLALHLTSNVYIYIMIFYIV